LKKPTKSIDNVTITTADNSIITASSWRLGQLLVKKKIAQENLKKKTIEDKNLDERNNGKTKVLRKLEYVFVCFMFKVMKKTLKSHQIPNLS
jgi:hypothetical protein